MLVGFYGRKRGILNDSLSKGLSDILMNIALPAMIVASFIMDFSNTMLKNAGLIVVFSVIIHILLIIVGNITFRKYDLDKRNILVFFSVFPNAGFMGLPLIDAIYGQIGIFYASIFMVPYQFLMWTYGQGLFQKKVEDPSAYGIKELLIKFKNPAIIGVMVGLIIFIFSIKVPYTIHKSISIVGGITSPLAMMIVGDKIAQIRFKELFADIDVYYGSFARSIIAPIITFIVLKSFNFDPLIINACVAIEAMPTAISVVILSEKYSGDTIFASKCVLISHLLSLITIPAMIILLLQ